jgi:hypothetical protein
MRSVSRYLGIRPPELFENPTVWPALQELAQTIDDLYPTGLQSRRSDAQPSAEVVVGTALTASWKLDGISGAGSPHSCRHSFDFRPDRQGQISFRPSGAFRPRQYPSRAILGAPVVSARR